jgi:hypothetical protein
MAISSRDLARALDIADVLDARINPLLPQPQGPWTRRVPELPDPGRRAYLAQIAAMMDDCTRRLDQHTAWTSTPPRPYPPEPSRPSGPCPPPQPPGASGSTRPPGSPPTGRPTGTTTRRPIGPESAHQALGQRAAWHEAFAALSPAAGSGIRTCRTGGCCYSATSTPPKPPGHPATPGKELRLARLGAFDALSALCAPTLAIAADAELLGHRAMQRLGVVDNHQVTVITSCSRRFVCVRSRFICG